ncbi:hypothetical protein BVY06_19505 [Pectobacterium odoriferum]|nr:hypothetical protein BVY06_19505 [Pectobacterium odoriferum]POE39910.1 hypothetical protein BV920_11000 [Pectobacterium odoriferum]
MQNSIKTIIVTIEVEIPYSAAPEDISNFVDVEFAQCGGMKLDNSCRDSFEIISHSWRAE